MPKRLLKDWTQSEKMEALSWEAEVFFTRLIMKADDLGNYSGNHKILKAHLFPLRDRCTIEQISEWINECASYGIIKKYVVEGKDYIHINDFGQRLRQTKPYYPQPAGIPTATGQQSDDNMPQNINMPNSHKNNDYDHMSAGCQRVVSGLSAGCQPELEEEEEEETEGGVGDFGFKPEIPPTETSNSTPASSDLTQSVLCPKTGRRWPPDCVKQFSREQFLKRVPVNASGMDLPPPDERDEWWLQNEVASPLTQGEYMLLGEDPSWWPWLARMMQSEEITTYSYLQKRVKAAVKKQIEKIEKQLSKS